MLTPPRPAQEEGLETLLAEHWVEQKNSASNHPQTCRKVERIHQTEKKWLLAQPPARTLQQLQQQLDALRQYYTPAAGTGPYVPAPRSIVGI